MKKVIYLILLITSVYSCKFDDNPYSVIREFDSGTYITPDGKVKYISGTPDSLVSVTDNYAVIQENISYVKKTETGMLADSILIYGHVYSRTPNPVVCGYDSVSKIDLIERLNQNSNYWINGTSEPSDFITSDDLDAGLTFRSGFGLHYETEYYVRSFVVTGKFVGGKPEYKDIAYNQRELQFTTKSPVDLWVGGDMLEAPADFPDNEYRGGTAFTYDGYLFVAQGHDEGPMGTSIIIDRYDPITNTWDNPPFATYPIAQDANFTNAVSFVIEKAKLDNNREHDCVYIGLGITNNEDEANVEFYRYDFDDNTGNPWLNITTAYDAQPFPGIGVEDAVAFSINGIGYVGLGTTGYADAVVPRFYKYDPSDRSAGHSQGTWTQIADFPGGPRTKAVCFKIGDNVYVGCGEDDNGNYKNDLWMCSQADDNSLTWVQRAAFPGTPRIDAVGFAIGENGYIGTGLDVDSVRSDFWRYNPFLNKWDQRAFYGGEPRYQAVGAGIKINDNDYRGFIGTGWNGTDYFNDFWHYRP
ncbi:MAG: hypothetical protein GXO50_09590 [Chlorobi bacterium]|nr:hypothetical protein [Chlorobiota bacterium]